MRTTLGVENEYIAFIKKLIMMIRLTIQNLLKSTMPRPKWSVTDSNFHDVWNYLNRNKPDLSIRLNRIHSASSLNTFVHEELTTNELSSMRSSIRMSKSRDNKELRNARDVNITISKDVHQLLLELCRRDESTISDCLDRHLSMLTEMPDNERNSLINKWT